MDKRKRSPHNHLHSTREDAPPKRPRMAGTNGKSFAQRMNALKPIVIQDSSDDEIPGSVHQGKDDSQSDISSLRSSPISQCHANISTPLGHKSSENRPGAQDLADGYDQGKPDFESESELEQPLEQPPMSHSGDETSEGGSYARRCLAAAKNKLDSNTLEHGELTERIKRLAKEQIEIRQFMQLIGESDL